MRRQYSQEVAATQRASAVDDRVVPKVAVSVEACAEHETRIYCSKAGDLFWRGSIHQAFA